MSVNMISDKSLDMKSCSLFLHFLINAFALIFIADESTPRFLNCNSSYSSFQDFVSVNNKRFLKVFE